LAVLVVAGLVACGDNDDPQDAAGGQGTPAEMGFLRGMAHHHEMAIQTAEIAQDRGESDFVKGLANDILRTQRVEISEMRRLHQRAFGAGLQPDPKGHDRLGLSAEEAGMTHTSAMNHEMRKAKPFDKAFIDMMVPHHLGAIRMAEAVKKDPKNSEVRNLADRIIRAQAREVREMNAFRKRTYGAEVPSPMSQTGGGEKPLTVEGGGHQGH
jgi:uncharacterized protein (DUF305 family)